MAFQSRSFHSFHSAYSSSHSNLTTLPTLERSLALFLLAPMIITSTCVELFDKTANVIHMEKVDLHHTNFLNTDIHDRSGETEFVQGEISQQI